MSRSIGDYVAKSIGVISDPDIEIHEITQKYSVLVLGSDGIFDYLRTDEIADIVWEDRNRPANEIARTLVDLSVKRWKENENVIDDCTCIVVYLIK